MHPFARSLKAADRWSSNADPGISLPPFTPIISIFIGMGCAHLAVCLVPKYLPAAIVGADRGGVDPVLVVMFFINSRPRSSRRFPFPSDLTPISFTLTAFLAQSAVFGLRLFDLIPIARHTVMEHIPEMVFVVDAHDRVLDANSVAQKVLGKPHG